MAMMSNDQYVLLGLASIQEKVDTIQCSIGTILREISSKRESLRSDTSSISDTAGAVDSSKSRAVSIDDQTPMGRGKVRASILSVLSAASTAATDDDFDFGQDESTNVPPVAVINGVPVSAVGLHMASRIMRDIPWERILVLRRLHKLGFDAPSALVQYFGQFGVIEKLILLPSRRKLGRMRPSSTGFIVLASPEIAQTALACGFHMIRGVGVQVTDYQEQSCQGYEEGFLLDAIPSTFYGDLSGGYDTNIQNCFTA